MGDTEAPCTPKPKNKLLARVNAQTPAGKPLQEKRISVSVIFYGLIEPT